MRRVEAMERSGLEIIKWPGNAGGCRPIQIALVGDYGGKGKAASTKFGMQIINTAHPNRPSNFTLFAAFFANDTRPNLQMHLAPIIKQIEQINQEQESGQYIKITSDGGEKIILIIEWYKF